MYRWNNFHRWLPGGTYRTTCNSARDTLLKAYLDRILEEQNFDLPQFRGLMRRKSDYFHEYSSLLKRVNQQEWTPEESERWMELGRLEDETYRQLDALLEPVVKRMIELGYTETELTQ